jgi:L-lactate permease
MKNPWLSYTLLRLGLFALIFWIFLAFDFNPYFAAIIAATVSFAISLLFLDRQRKAMSAQVAEKLARDKSGSYQDQESDLENQILDSAPLSETEVDNNKPDSEK